MLFGQSIKQQEGFTLLELSLVMIISGLILGAMVSSYLKWNDLLRSNKTQENMSIIEDALSAYSSRNYRVPCPADPANIGATTEPIGAERGSNVSGSIGNCVIAMAQGIVPYKTLGISSDYIRDGWGNYITYKVNPTFTQDPDSDVVQVHARCRTTDWFEGSILVGTSPNQWLDGGRNISPKKARFCCAQSPAANRINVYSSATVMGNRALVYEEDVAGWYASATSLADPYDTHTSEDPINYWTPTDGVDPVTYDPSPAVQPAPAVTPAPGNYPRSYYSNIIYGGGISDGANPVYGYTDMAVYALVSHGKNGSGAFLGNGIAGKNAMGIGVAEIDNANLKDVWNLPHVSTDDTNFFDDIVVWQTQTDMLAHLSRDSCVVP